MGFHVENDGTDPVARLVESLGNKAEQIGLYLREIAVTQISPEGLPTPVRVESTEELVRLIQSGQATVKMMVIFQIGDLAFSKRMEDPEGHNVDVVASEMIPPEHRLLQERIREMVENRATIEDLFGGDEDDGLAGV